jgi:hypothetical protein
MKNLGRVVARWFISVLTLIVLSTLIIVSVGSPVSAATKPPVNFGRIADTSYGGIPSQYSSFTISDNRTWISVGRPSLGMYSISATTNNGGYRTGTVTMVNGSTTYTIAVTQTGVSLSFSMETPVSPDAATKYFSITCNRSWTLTENQTWANCIYDSGSSGTSTNGITYDPNISTGPRYVNVTVTAGEISQLFTVTQEGQVLSDPTDVVLTSPWECTFDVSVASNASYTVNVPGWMTLRSPWTGSAGNSYISATANTNTGPARVGIITISTGAITQTVMVSQPSGVVLTLSPTSIGTLSTSSAYVKDISITANNPWTATTSAPQWLYLTKSSGTGSDTTTLSVTKNPGQTERVGTITVTSCGVTKTLTIVQPGQTLQVSPDVVLTSPAASGNINIAVSSNTTYSVTVPTWINTVSIPAGGNSTVVVSAQANTGPARAGYVTISTGAITQTVKVSQPSGVVLTISPTSIGTLPDAKDYARYIQVTANNPWTVTTDKPEWIHSSGPNELNTATWIYADANTSASERTGTVTFTCLDVTKTLTITQPGVTLSVPNNVAGDPIILTSPNATTIDFDIVSNGQGIISAPSWVTLYSPWEWSGNAHVNAVASENTTGSARTGTFTITAGGITKKVYVSQPSGAITLNPTSIGTLADSMYYLEFIRVTANHSWDAVSSDPTWLHATDSDADFDLSAISADPNTSASARIGTLTFTCLNATKTLTITQPGITLEVPNNRLADPIILTSPEATTFSFTFTSNGEGTIDAPAWITMYSPSTWSGNAYVSAVATENTGPARTGYFTIAAGGITKHVYVSQPGTELTLSRSTYITNDHYYESEFFVYLDCNRSWEVLELPDWITLENIAGSAPAMSGTGDADLKATVQVNPSGSLREDTIIFGAWTGAEYVTASIAVTQGTPGQITIWNEWLDVEEYEDQHSTTQEAMDVFFLKMYEYYQDTGTINNIFDMDGIPDINDRDQIIHIKYLVYYGEATFRDLFLENVSKIHIIDIRENSDDWGACSIGTGIQLTPDCMVAGGSYSSFFEEFFHSVDYIKYSGSTSSTIRDLLGDSIRLDVANSVDSFLDDYLADGDVDNPMGANTADMTYTAMIAACSPNNLTRLGSLPTSLGIDFTAMTPTDRSTMKANLKLFVLYDPWNETFDSLSDLEKEVYYAMKTYYLCYVLKSGVVSDCFDAVTNGDLVGCAAHYSPIVGDDMHTYWFSLDGTDNGMEPTEFIAQYCGAILIRADMTLVGTLMPSSKDQIEILLN